ncbi:MAG: hypothetical protein AAFX06_11890 [Planctomycetota bacterium]
MMRHLTSFAAATLLCSFTVAFANPTNEKPLTGMAAHDTISGTKARIEAMYERFYEWEKACITNQATMKRGGKVAHRALAKNFSNIYLAKWYAHDLTLMGEPAGFDLERRYEMLRKEYRAFVPAVAALRRQEIQKLSKEIPKRDKTIQRCKEMAGKGQIVEAEAELRKLLLRHLESLFYLDDATAKRFQDPISSPHNQLRAEVDRQHRDKWSNDAEAKIASYTEAVKRLAEESTRVVNELSSGPTAKLAEDQTGNAADAIQYVGQLWGSASAAVSRSIGMAWAFRRGDPESIAISFRGDLQQAEKVAVDAINRILASLATQPEEDVRKIYPRVLEELSILQRRYKGRLAEEFAPALEKIQMQHAGLGQTVQRYTAATVEPTRWMNRFASRQSQTLKAGFPPIETALNDEYEANSQARPEMYGLQVRKRVVTPKSQAEQMSWLAADSQALVGAQVQETATTRLRGTKLAIGKQTIRYYTNLVADFPAEMAVREMKESLLIDESHGPLSYSSADAISSAALGEFQAVGGKIKRLTPEASVTRIATIPDVAHALVPLNAVPVIDSRMTPLQQLLWRVELEPTWVSHRLFNLGKGN